MGGEGQRWVSGVRLETRRLGPTPALLARPAEGDGPLPGALWLHGFDSDKEVHRPELERLARAGFLAVGLDAPGHGERRLAGFEERFAGPKPEVRRRFFALVAAAVGEIGEVCEVLIAEGDALPRLGIVGVSMGGCAVYGALPAEPRLAAGVALLATPRWPRPDSPHRRPQAFAPKALLSVAAERDEAVPPGEARRLHRDLVGVYREAPERHAYVELSGERHVLSRKGWWRALSATVEWLRRFLVEEPAR